MRGRALAGMTATASPDRVARHGLFAAAAAAWAVLLLQTRGLLPAPGCIAADTGIGGRFAFELAAFLGSPLLWPTVAAWTTMAAAMMLPLLAGPVGHVAVRSFAARRARAVGIFLLGYALIWAVALAVLLALILALRSAGLPLIGRADAWPYLAAALWHGSAARRAAIYRCHRPLDLRAFGRAADRDCLRYGLQHGGWCVATCWALMAAPVLDGHALGPMAMVALIAFAARYERRPQIRAAQFLLVMLAGLALLDG